jgi:outer membrane protein assembly factor BamB
MRFLASALAVIVSTGISPAQDGSYPLLGGTPFRNMTAPTAKGLVPVWSIKKNARQNILWSADLGTTTYGGVVVSGGKIFIGTNNERPRDPAVTGDRGALYCFNAKDGSFLWQALHEKLPEPDKNDWPKQGVASTPVVEGDKLWYVSNRAEVVCLDVAGTPGSAKAKEL